MMDWLFGETPPLAERDGPARLPVDAELAAEVILRTLDHLWPQLLLDRAWQRLRARARVALDAERDATERGAWAGAALARDERLCGNVERPPIWEGEAWRDLGTWTYPRVRAALFPAAPGPTQERSRVRPPDFDEAWRRVPIATYAFTMVERGAEPPLDLPALAAAVSERGEGAFPLDDFSLGSLDWSELCARAPSLAASAFERRLRPAFEGFMLDLLRHAERGARQVMGREREALAEEALDPLTVFQEMYWLLEQMRVPGRVHTRAYLRSIAWATGKRAAIALLQELRELEPVDGEGGDDDVVELRAPDPRELTDWDWLVAAWAAALAECAGQRASRLLSWHAAVPPATRVHWYASPLPHDGVSQQAALNALNQADSRDRHALAEAIRPKLLEPARRRDAADAPRVVFELFLPTATRVLPLYKR